MDPIGTSEFSKAMDLLWNRFLPEIRERVTILENAAAAFAAATLSAQQQLAAHAAAHKLAGVLGTFSLTRGTVLARELELMYSPEDPPRPETMESLVSTAAELRTLIETHKGSHP